MRRPVLALLGLCLAGVLALVVLAGARETQLAFTIGVTPAGPQRAIEPGQTGCQGTIDVPEGGAFDAVEVALGTYGRPGPALAATIREQPGGAVLESGRLAGGYPDVADGLQRIALDREVPAGSRIAVCLRNAGSTKVAPFGNGDVVNGLSTYTVDGEPAGTDITIRFQQPAQSMLSRFGEVADRAALFRPGWVGAWTYWLMAAVIPLGIPALLAFALPGALRAAAAASRA